MLHKKCLTWFGREKFQEYFYKYQLPSWSTWRATIDWVQVIIIPEVLNRSSVTRLENRRKGITYLDRDYSTIYWLPLSDTHRNHRSIGDRQEQQQQQQQVWWPEQEEIKHILKTKGIPVIWKLPLWIEYPYNITVVGTPTIPPTTATRILCAWISVFIASLAAASA